MIGAERPAGLRVRGQRGQVRFLLGMIPAVQRFGTSAARDVRQSAEVALLEKGQPQKKTPAGLQDGRSCISGKFSTSGN